jgi:hypothetical protein
MWLSFEIGLMLMPLRARGALVARVADEFDIPVVAIRTLSDKAGGKAEVFYENFSREATDQSVRIVLRMLNIINWCGRYCFLSKITTFLD